MPKSRPRPRPARSCLLICVCLLLTSSSPAFAFKPQPPRTPSTAAAAHRRPQPTYARAGSIDIRDRVVSHIWRVSTARYPLIGWPSWGPKLHEAVIVERRDANAAAVGPAYLLFDFIPVSATEISTATTLFRGQAVPGIVREKVRECMLEGLEGGTRQTPT